MHRSLSFFECPLREFGQDARIVHDKFLFVLDVSPNRHIVMQPFALLRKRPFPKVSKQLSFKAQPKPSVKKELETQACDLIRQLKYVPISLLLNGSNGKYLIVSIFLTLFPFLTHQNYKLLVSLRRQGS